MLRCDHIMRVINFVLHWLTHRWMDLLWSGGNCRWWDLIGGVVNWVYAFEGYILSPVSCCQSLLLIKTWTVLLSQTLSDTMLYAVYHCRFGNYRDSGYGLRILKLQAKYILFRCTPWVFWHSTRKSVVHRNHLWSSENSGCTGCKWVHYIRFSGVGSQVLSCV